MIDGSFLELLTFGAGLIGGVATLYLKRIATLLDKQIELVGMINARVVKLETKAELWQKAHP